jgi:hypothetical protein
MTNFISKIERKYYIWIIFFYSVLASFIGYNWFSEKKEICVAFIDVAISLIGFFLAFVEIFRMESVSKIIQTETNTAIKETKELLSKFQAVADISSAMSLISLIQDEIKKDNYKEAGIRLDRLFQLYWSVVKVANENSENLAKLMSELKYADEDKNKISDAKKKKHINDLTSVYVSLVELNNK